MAQRSIHRSPRAARDLEELSDFLYDEAGLEVGLRFVEAVDAAFARLLRMPGLGAPRASVHPDHPSLRMWPVPDFPRVLIFYAETPDGIDVVRVLHASRDIKGVIADE